MATETSIPVAAGLFTRNWWVFLFRGVLALFLGLAMLRRPELTLRVLMLGFVVYAIFEGGSALVAAIRGWDYRKDRWLLLMEAVAGIGLGLLTLHRPGMTAFVLIFFMAIWALVTGVLRIVEAVNLGNTSGRGWLIVGGVASILFAFLVLFRPLVGALTMVTVIGAYAVILGITEIVLAFKLRARRGLDRSGVRHPAYPRAA